LGPELVDSGQDLTSLTAHSYGLCGPWQRPGPASVSPLPLLVGKHHSRVRVPSVWEHPSLELHS